MLAEIGLVEVAEEWARTDGDSCDFLDIAPAFRDA
jgi:hypothetical protein